MEDACLAFLSLPWRRRVAGCRAMEIGKHNQVVKSIPLLTAWFFVDPNEELCCRWVIFYCSLSLCRAFYSIIAMLLLCKSFVVASNVHVLHVHQREYRNECDACQDVISFFQGLCQSVRDNVLYFRCKRVYLINGGANEFNELDSVIMMSIKNTMLKLNIPASVPTLSASSPLILSLKRILRFPCTSVELRAIPSSIPI